MIPKIPLFNEQGNKTGDIEPDGVLRKFISDPKRHQLRVPPAWAVDTLHLVMLEGLGGSAVELAFHGGKRVRATLSAFKEHGIKVDRGHGQQTALTLEHWR